MQIIDQRRSRVVDAPEQDSSDILRPQGGGKGGGTCVGIDKIYAAGHPPVPRGGGGGKRANQSFGLCPCPVRLLPFPSRVAYERPGSAI